MSDQPKPKSMALAPARSPGPKPRSKLPSPAKLSRAALEAEGWTVDVVEYWNPFAQIRKDLFGFGDLFAVKEGAAPRIVQTTSLSNFATRRSKILESEKAAVCLAGGVEIVIHGWDAGKGGGPVLRSQTLTARDLPGTQLL